MAELNLKQIADKLNAEFCGETRKLIFWYDANAEFAEDVDELRLENAKVYRLQRDNQFATKYFLECEDTETNYLIYAPFPKPPVTENHLADMIHYSREFFADRASLIVLDLNMDDRCKPILQHYGKFFGAKDRTRAFYELEIGNYNRATIEIGMMAVLCRCKLPSFEEIIRCVLTEGGFEANEFLDKFDQYDLLDAFWQQCAEVFGYANGNPTLEKLVMTMFVVYAQRVIHAELPAAWRAYSSSKPGNIVAFLDNLMNSVLYAASFDEMSARMYSALDAGAKLAALGADAVADCNLFAGVDELLIRWMIERLLNEDTTAKLNGRTIPEVCDRRKKMHFGERFKQAYDAICTAWYLLNEPAAGLSSDMKEIVKNYVERGFEADRKYREFYLHYDAIEDAGTFDALRALVERAYLNKFLNPTCTSYALAFATGGETGLPKQRDFYETHVRKAKERVVVIISDALRYEVGRSLYEKLEMDEKCSVRMSAMQSVLPSVTSAGMAALLPNRELKWIDSKNVLADGQPNADLNQREALLQAARPASRAVQFDALKGMSQEQLRSVFARQEVVYVYHNQIDARGDSPRTENEVFAACEEAVKEICWLIRRLTTCANTSHFIVTADHGFIYKRDRLTESDMIGGVVGASRRYAVTDAPIAESGVGNVPLCTVMGGDGARAVNFPVGSDLFKAPGAGLNYVHGGCSPQEMIVPVLLVKTERARKETDTAKIDLISLSNKITNLIATLDMIQTEPVSDVVKEAKYQIYFIAEDGEKISSENSYVADRRDTDASKRVFKLRFTFKNQRYDKGRKYFLIAKDANDLEVLRREFTIDMAFADDFGF